MRLIESDQPSTLGELARMTDLPKSTASRLLRALERHELVQRDPASGAMRPGSVLVQYARRGAGNLDLVALARPTLDPLADESGETVNLAVPSGDRRRDLAQVDSRYILGATNWVGRQLVLHASALGKVLLAAAPPSAAHALDAPPRTRSPTTSPAARPRPRSRGAATRRASRSSSPVCSPSPPACASGRAP